MHSKKIFGTIIFCITQICICEFNKKDFSDHIFLQNFSSLVLTPSIEICDYSATIMKFEIKFGKTSGLIFYAEDSLTNTFSSLKLLDRGRVRLDMGIFSSKNQSDIIPDYISCYIDLSDNVPLIHNLSTGWCHVEIQISQQKLTLIIEKSKNTQTFPNHYYKKFQLHKNRIGKYLYFAGLPQKMKQDATKRVQFSSAVESYNKGEIKHLQTWNCHNKTFSKPSVVNGEFYNNFETGNPEEIPVATFLQDAYIYNSINIPTVSDMDAINLEFKTKQDFSHIFYVGTQPSHSKTGLQYILMYLDDRQLGIRIKHDRLPESTFKVTCVSIYSTCTDNRWHTISVSRKKTSIKVVVDGKVVVDRMVGLTVTHLISQSITFGGMIPMTDSDFSIQETASFLQNLTNFKGCMQKIIYSTDNANLDILAQAKIKRYFLTRGEIYFDKCSDLFIIKPISFTTEASYITLAGWAWAQKGKLQFSFKTVESNALLAYQKSETSQLNQFDFYAFEIRESFLHFSINTGSGVYQQKVSSTPVSDGLSHYVKLWFEDGNVEVQLDADKKIEHTNSLYKTLDTTRDLYIGGIPETLVSFLPHSLWSGILRQGFVGCLLDISVNGDQFDLALKAESENITGIVSGCSGDVTDKGLCANRPCMDGRCIIGYNRFICDCSRTNYTGDTCGRVAPLVKFNGFQQMIINMPNGFQSECEDVTLRFLTTRPNGIFIVTKSRVSGASDRLEIFLENGKLNILLNFGRGNKIIRSDYNCFDGNWHTLKLKRRQLSVILIIDDMEKKYNFSGSSKLLSNDIIAVGKYETDKFSRYFTGYMMHFTFNGINYFELAKEESPSNIEVTATIGDAEPTKEFPISFPSVNSYIRLPKIDMYGDFKLEFLIKTRNNKGSVLQLYGKSGDYLILEIVHGYLNLLFNWGNGFNKKVRKEIKIDDNIWHRVILIRENSKSSSFAFRIDSQPIGERAHIELKAGGLNFNSFENLFLGSAEKYLSKTNQIRDKVTSSQGFEGCISSFYMNQTKYVSTKSVYQNLLAIALANNGVVEDCPEDHNYQVSCRPNICHSGGRCIQQWIRIRCDCAMTTFIGERCDKVSKTLKFNDYPAYLIYKLSPTKNTTLDELAFGIQTSVITSSSIILIEGDGKQSDFISARLMKDKGRALLIIEYNLGSGITRLVESSVNIADGFYHRVAFRRNGNLASLQIDDYNRIIASPKGKTSIHFNQQRTIYVGKYPFPNQRTGRSVQNDKTFDSFSGYLSGLYFNRIPLSDMIDNISYAGIKLLNRSNVYVENKFIPNFQSKQSILSEQGEKENNPTKKNNPIVVAKSNCSNIEPLHNLDCKVSDSAGIIRPIVSYKINTVTHSQKITTTPDNDIYTENTKSESSTIYKSLEINNSGVINIWLIIGFSVGGSLLLVFITCFIYRCFRKDEGSYNVEDDHIFIDPSHKSLNLLNSSKDIELKNNYQTLNSATFNSSKHKQSRNEKSTNTKEWYV